MTAQESKLPEAVYGCHNDICKLFPACAGMNRNLQAGEECVRAVPRMRGDEPDDHMMDLTKYFCSPHARG